ncbi:MAG: fumarate hydratase C-terminal domain-containing protein, partial [Halanaerobiales bacterium]
KDAMIKNKAVYLGAVGGAAALISKHITEAEIIAYPELGPEAIRRLKVESLPLFVINDIYGGDLYQDGVKKYKQE